MSNIQYKPITDECLTGGKDGVYNPQTKQITWRVWVNYEDPGLKNAYIEDAIPADQTFAPGSTRIYDYTATGSQKHRGAPLHYADGSVSGLFRD